MNARWRQAPGPIVDALIAAAFFALSLLLVVELVDDTTKRIVAGVVVLGHTAPLAFRRRWPIAVICAMALTALLSLLAQFPAVALGPGVLVAAYSLGATTERRRAWPLLTGLFGVMTLVVLANGADGGTVATNALAVALAWWLGDRSRQAGLDAEAERLSAEEALHRSALDERMRIARELHDVVAHSMTVIAVQAGAARFAGAGQAPEATEVFAAIERTSREALDEMRRLLTVLRDDARAGDRVPTPRLEDIDALVDATRRTGLAVDVRRCGTPGDLPAGVELCAYRIVQEALTNVCKHARARTASVRLGFEADRVELEIVDDGVGATGTKAGAPGHGLVGMRERVGLYGGVFDAGPRRDGGFRVLATLPVGADA